MWSPPCGSSCNRAMAHQIFNWKNNEDFYKCNRTSIFVAKIYNCVILNISAPSVYKLHFITYLVLQSDHHHHRAVGSHQHTHIFTLSFHFIFLKRHSPTPLSCSATPLQWAELTPTPFQSRPIRAPEKNVEKLVDNYSEE